MLSETPLLASFGFLKRQLKVIRSGHRPVIYFMKITITSGLLLVSLKAHKMRGCDKKNQKKKTTNKVYLNLTCSHSAFYLLLRRHEIKPWVKINSLCSREKEKIPDAFLLFNGLKVHFLELAGLQTTIPHFNKPGLIYQHTQKDKQPSRSKNIRPDQEQNEDDRMMTKDDKGGVCNQFSAELQTHSIPLAFQHTVIATQRLHVFNNIH